MKVKLTLSELLPRLKLTFIFNFVAKGGDRIFPFENAAGNSAQEYGAANRNGLDCLAIPTGCHLGSGGMPIGFP